MMRYLVLTFVGDDRPGFVQDIAGVIADGGGSWVESRMCQLEGKFAGLARISVSDEQFESLKNALIEFPEHRFTLNVEELEETARQVVRRYDLDIIGHDRPGILREVTTALARNTVNLLEVTSNVLPATMTGIPMFSCKAIIEVGEDTDLGLIDEQLADIAGELGIDIRIDHEAETLNDFSTADQ